MEEILVVVFCLLLNALFAAYEMAFVSVPRPELRQLARQGRNEAIRLLQLRENPERTLSILQVGITLVGALAAAVGGSGAAESLEPWFINRGMSEVSAEFFSIVIIVLPLTYVNVVAGELVPKSLALRNPLRIVLRGARLLFWADRILSPIVSFLDWSTKKILQKFFKRGMKSTVVPQTTVEIDSLNPIHQQLIINLANIETRPAKDFLVPWTDVNRVSATDELEEVTTVVFNSGHTRLPVIDGEAIKGILHTKEFLAFRETGNRNWTSILRPALKVQSSDSALKILRLMQEKRSHMSIIFSSTGEKLGVATLEDIIEEIVGDLYDEDDDGRVRKIFAATAKARNPSKDVQ